VRNIAKGPAPLSLLQHRRAAHAGYDNYADKQSLRDSLVAEQRGICCFCMSRIDADPAHLKVAHWHSQSRHPEEQLDYGNLLGACLGGAGAARSMQHCDTRQGDADLSRNPANRAHDVESWVRFEGDGTISSSDPVFDRELNEVLNLNIAWLKANRAAMLAAFKTMLDKRGHLGPEAWKQMLRDWNGESDAGPLRPFCQVVIYWLRKRLARE
jgi:uncharacterized protein (TIGR02646 family)